MNNAASRFLRLPEEIFRRIMNSVPREENPLLLRVSQRTRRFVLMNLTTIKPYRITGAIQLQDFLGYLRRYPESALRQVCMLHLVDIRDVAGTEIGGTFIDILRICGRVHTIEFEGSTAAYFLWCLNSTVILPN
ncbi:hypothetical protein, partial, partial [Parasitella parasitica]